MAQAESIIFFQTGGMALVLYPRHELAKAAHVAPEGHGFNSISLACNLRHPSELDAVLKAAAATGTTVVKPAQEASGEAIRDISLTPTGGDGRSPGFQPSRSQ
jgi:hypothetical protein